MYAASRERTCVLLGTMCLSCLFPVSLLVLLVHVTVLHRSSAEHNHRTDQSNNGSLIVRRVKDHLKKEANIKVRNLEFLRTTNTVVLYVRGDRHGQWDACP
jgi:hypothetical protein